MMIDAAGELEDVNSAIKDVDLDAETAMFRLENHMTEEIEIGKKEMDDESEAHKERKSESEKAHKDEKLHKSKEKKRQNGGSHKHRPRSTSRDASDRNTPPRHSRASRAAYPRGHRSGGSKSPKRAPSHERRPRSKSPRIEASLHKSRASRSASPNNEVPSSRRSGPSKSPNRTQSMFLGQGSTESIPQEPLRRATTAVGQESTAKQQIIDSKPRNSETPKTSVGLSRDKPAKGSSRHSKSPKSSRNPSRYHMDGSNGSHKRPSSRHHMDGSRRSPSRSPMDGFNESNKRPSRMDGSGKSKSPSSPQIGGSNRTKNSSSCYVEHTKLEKQDPESPLSKPGLFDWSNNPVSRPSLALAKKDDSELKQADTHPEKRESRMQQNKLSNPEEPTTSVPRLSRGARGTRQSKNPNPSKSQPRPRLERSRSDDAHNKKQETGRLVPQKHRKTRLERARTTEVAHCKDSSRRCHHPSTTGRPSLSPKRLHRIPSTEERPSSLSPTHLQRISTDERRPKETTTRLRPPSLTSPTGLVRATSEQVTGVRHRKPRKSRGEPRCTYSEEEPRHRHSEGCVIDKECCEEGDDSLHKCRSRRHRHHHATSVLHAQLEHGVQLQEQQVQDWIDEMPNGSSELLGLPEEQEEEECKHEEKKSGGSGRVSTLLNAPLAAASMGTKVVTDTAVVAAKTTVNATTVTATAVGSAAKGTATAVGSAATVTATVVGSGARATAQTAAQFVSGAANAALNLVPFSSQEAELQHHEFRSTQDLRTSALGAPKVIGGPRIN